MGRWGEGATVQSDGAGSDGAGSRTLAPDLQAFAPDHRTPHRRPIAPYASYLTDHE
jgi:hypothetical protein